MMTKGEGMADPERYEVLVIGSGESGKYIAWTMAKAGRRTAVVERKWVGGSCPNIACLPSKNLIHSARVASLARRNEEFGLAFPSLATNMQRIQERTQRMVDELVKVHLDRYKASGAELIMGSGRFVGPRTVSIALNSGGQRIIAAEQVFINVGTRSTMPNISGLDAAKPMTHIEALNLDRVPEHMIMLGGGYIGLELAQAMRRFGSRVTVIEQGPQLAGREDPDVGRAIQELFQDEVIDVALDTEIRAVEGISGQSIHVKTTSKGGEHMIGATDLLVAVGRAPNTKDLGLELAGIEVDARGYVKTNERLETTAENVCYGRLRRQSTVHTRCFRRLQNCSRQSEWW